MAKKKPQISLSSAEEVRDKITAKQTKQIQAMFTKLAKEAREKAKKLEGRDNISSIIQKKYLEDLAKELEHQLNADFANLKKNLEQDMTQVSESVIDCVREFEESVGMPISNSWLNVPVDAVEAVQSGKLYAGNWTLSSRIWGMERKVSKDIHTVIAEGIAANKSAYDIAKDLEKYVDPKAKKDWNWSKVYPGTNRKVDYSAQRLARTMVSHAYQFSFVESTKDNPFITKYKWISSHDKRVCPICKERDGKLFDKDKLPLDHPNGRCTFVSVFNKSATQISDEMAAWVKGKEGDFPKIDEYMKKKFGTDRYDKAMQMAQQVMKQQESGNKITVKKKVPEFTWQQKKFLSEYGYTVDNIPDYDTWFSVSSFKDFDSLLTYANNKGMSINEYYEKYIQKVKYKWKEEVVPYPGDSDGSKFDREEWLDILSKNSIRDLEKKFDSWIDELSYEEKYAVRKYTSSAYKSMNKYLRGEQSFTEYLDEVNGVKEALKNASKYNDRDIVVRRGSGYNSLKGLLGKKSSIDREYVEKNKEKLIGSVCREDGFLSTSPDPSGGFNREIEYIIKVPQGSQGAYIASISEFRSEKEYLLNAGSTFVVKDIDTEYSTIKVYLELVL